MEGGLLVLENTNRIAVISVVHMAHKKEENLQQQGDTYRAWDLVRGPWLCSIWGFPIIRVTILGGSNNKDYCILGSILESPYFGNDHIGPDASFAE